jgi:hypothetical protein
MQTVSSYGRCRWVQVIRILAPVQSPHYRALSARLPCRICWAPSRA